MTLHPNLAPVELLVGRWRGPGRGSYPTIEAFDYVEEVVFTDVGKPFLSYQQRTWSPSGTPMHTESGFLRVPAPGAVEFTLAQPTGQVELAEGALTRHDGVIELTIASRVLNTATAKHVSATERHYQLTDDELVTSMAMAAVGQPMTHHLASTLHRVR